MVALAIKEAVENHLCEDVEVLRVRAEDRANEPMNLLYLLPECFEFMGKLVSFFLVSCVCQHQLSIQFFLGR